MFDPLQALRKLMGAPEPKPVTEMDIAEAALHIGIKKVEAMDFCGFLIESMGKYIVEAKTREEIEKGYLPPDTIESWQRLDDDARLYVFVYLLGALYGSMVPPDDYLPAVL